jgi:hypothetical protein
MENHIPSKWKWKEKRNYLHIWKADFNLKLFKRDKEGHYKLIKGMTYQKDIITVNL